MKNNVVFFFVIVLSVMVGGVGSYVVFHDGGTEDGAGAEKQTVSGATRKMTVVKKTKVPGETRKKVTEISIVNKNGKTIAKIENKEQIRPVVKPNDDDVDESDLPELQKVTLKKLQDALDRDDWKGVRKVIKEMMRDGNVPICMRSKAVEALRWFGEKAVADLKEFVGDENPEVAEEALSGVEEGLSDFEMSDYERALYVTELMRELADGDKVDALLNSLNDMRNSVKALAAKDILVNGSDAAKKLMQEQLEMYFDEDVVDVSTVDKWQKMNPDDPEDDAFYGSDKGASDGAEK